MSSRDWSQILRGASNEFLNEQKISKLEIVMIDTLEVVGNFWRNMKKLYIPVQSITYLEFRTLQIALSYNTTRESCIKVTLLVCSWWKAISSKSKCQIRVCLLLFPITPYLFAVVYMHILLFVFHKRVRVHIWNLVKLYFQYDYPTRSQIFTCHGNANVVTWSSHCFHLGPLFTYIV